ncbi:MAG TPA: hypothetical protein VFN64_04865 [Burkholderiaceae bacterium]|nr:hypothetical protein [Burkholderiaceae bacterium]
MRPLETLLRTRIDATLAVSTVYLGVSDSGAYYGRTDRGFETALIKRGVVEPVLRSPTRDAAIKAHWAVVERLTEGDTAATAATLAGRIVTWTSGGVRLAVEAESARPVRRRAIRVKR